MKLRSSDEARIEIHEKREGRKNAISKLMKKRELNIKREEECEF